MALIRKFEKSSMLRTAVHEPVDCTYTVSKMAPDKNIYKSIPTGQHGGNSAGKRANRSNSVPKRSELCIASFRRRT
jgi:hypothetical protein